MRIVLASFLVLITSGLQAAGQTSLSAEALDWIKKLAGDWSGSIQWSGARSEQGKIDARYRVTGNGTAIVEDLIQSGTGTPIMTSVYHLDAGNLRMTHYCGAGNQPRLKAGSIDAAQKIIRFDFVDITNLATPAT